jgi:hypothetical protein
MGGRVAVGWDEPDETEAWMAWRNAGLDRLPEADELGRAIWNDATHRGYSLLGGQPSDLTALGLEALRTRAAGSTDDPAEDTGHRASDSNEVASDQGAPATPAYRTVTARPGDSISRLMGTSRPGAIGQFLNLNELKGSGLQAGASYRVPTSYDDPTHEEIAIGNRLLRSDNARLAAARLRPAGQAGDALFAQRFNAGQNVWTGEVPGKPPAPRVQATTADDADLWALAGKDAIGAGAYALGSLIGVPRAALHAARDIKDLGQFGLDASGALGPKAQALALQDAKDKAHVVLQYGRAVQSDPSRVVSDVGDLSKAAIDSINPFDAPASGTLGEIAAHEFKKGENFGEGAINVAAAIAAPELEFGAIRAANFGATKAARVAKLVERGANPRLAEYLAEPYDGMGHHAVFPRRFRIPDSAMGIAIDPRLAGKPLPGWLVDSPLNISIPLGMSRDDFYKYHYGVDRRFHGARLPADLNGGRGWSGKREGARRYNPVRRAWAGVPVPLKGGIAAVGTGDGFGVYSTLDQRDSQ